MHSWEVIGDILKSGVTNGIICDIGSPVIHHGNLYNCRVILMNSKVIAIRPKMNLADGDNYFETRWFGFWRDNKKIG
jgi:NAD+ synthase (glutamine-hydrolysing)